MLLILHLLELLELEKISLIASGLTIKPLIQTLKALLISLEIQSQPNHMFFQLETSMMLITSFNQLKDTMPN